MSETTECFNVFLYVLLNIVLIIVRTIKPSHCNEQDYQGSKILLLPFYNYGQKCPWGFDILWKKCWIYFLPRKTQKPLAKVAFFAQLPSCWAKINQYIKVTIPFILNIPPHRSSCRGEEPIKNIGGRMGQVRETVRISRLSAGCWLLENITPHSVPYRHENFFSPADPKSKPSCLEW